MTRVGPPVSAVGVGLPEDQIADHKNMESP